MPSSRFQALVGYLLDNLFDISTILVAGYLVIRHQIQPFTSSDIAELATWILAVLGLIAVSGLWDRNRRLNRIEKLSEESRDLVLRRISGKVRASDFFRAKRLFSEETFTSANKIFLSGITLSRTIREFEHILASRLAAGAHIRIIIINPANDSTVAEAASRSNVPIDEWRARLQVSQQTIHRIPKTRESKGRLEIGYLPYTPSFGMVMIDHDKPHGVCFVELYHHETHEPGPAFELRAADDPHWYEFFKKQWGVLWERCNPKEQLPNTEVLAEKLSESSDNTLLRPKS
jgi:hypothetical protein